MDDLILFGCLIDFVIYICEFILKFGVGFVVVLIGDVMMMLGLLKKLVVFNMDVDENGNV